MIRNQPCRSGTSLNVSDGGRNTTGIWGSSSAARDSIFPSGAATWNFLTLAPDVSISKGRKGNAALVGARVESEVKRAAGNGAASRRISQQKKFLSVFSAGTGFLTVTRPSVIDGHVHLPDSVPADDAVYLEILMKPNSLISRSFLSMIMHGWFLKTAIDDISGMTAGLTGTSRPWRCRHSPSRCLRVSRRTRGEKPEDRTVSPAPVSMMNDFSRR